MSAKIKAFPNGTIQVDLNGLRLYSEIVNGLKHVECVSYDEKTDSYTLESVHSEKFKPLFIALHNYKVENNIQ